ncbi:epoxide hydrolase family protein [Dictyobacter aurantiacus]|uniref:Multidrug MFS transporter n=1 Tax=Dictyobacter aurantiacus TaxID=1936993 RepID=A0A401ZT79_9CHLR|nr:epoxide hydrolase family protein [Dictyobacter aurantiacus]GCE10085.1 multidrug MFS transporter [Dictyobacter aurantiacus]
MSNNEIKFNRRHFLGTAAITLAAAQLSTIGNAEAKSMSANTPKADKSANPSDIRPFSVHFPQKDLDELHLRLALTRWPERETVQDTSQGVQLATIQDLTRYWRTRYDWRKIEAKLNALPQFITEIDGLDIHFIHVRSLHENAVPLIVTHGWPGSIIEQLKIIDPLTNPTAYGADASDAFHVVIPSLPGYGFSEQPTVTGWDPVHIASAWVTLMKRLGYDHFVAQGGDIGATVSHLMAVQAPPELLGFHTNLLSTFPVNIATALGAGAPAPAGLADDEKYAYGQLVDLTTKHFAYTKIMGTRPQTLYGLADSPVSLASWMLDHGDGYNQPAGAILSALNGTQEYLTRDDVLDNMTLYWLTNTGISAGRLYWENKFVPVSIANITVPAAFTVFPGEIYQAPHSWVQQAYHNLIYFNQVDKGGHFAAWEQPLLFAQELRAAFRSLR